MPQHAPADVPTITEAEIAHLPVPVQRYFRYCRYAGMPRAANAFITWEDVYLKMGQGKQWTRISCRQFNVVDVPARFDYMRSRYLGILPFEGSHMYHDGHGSMKVVLAGLFTVADGKGIEFDHSELVTVLSQTLFVPSYALQPYVTWESVNDSCAKAILRYDGHEVSGLFFFDATGACTHFDTWDRFYDNHDGTYVRVKWSAVIDSYREVEGRRYVSAVKAVWHTDEGEFEYFKGRVATIRFNVCR